MTLLTFLEAVLLETNYNKRGPCFQVWDTERARTLLEDVFPSTQVLGTGLWNDFGILGGLGKLPVLDGGNMICLFVL